MKEKIVRWRKHRSNEQNEPRAERHVADFERMTANESGTTAIVMREGSSQFARCELPAMPVIVTGSIGKLFRLIHEHA